MTLSIVREVTEKERPPRAVFVRYPFGHPLGQKGDARGQRRVLLEALKVLKEAQTPGEIVDLPFRWRRTDFAALPPLQLEGRELR